MLQYPQFLPYQKSITLNFMSWYLILNFDKVWGGISVHKFFYSRKQNKLFWFDQHSSKNVFLLSHEHLFFSWSKIYFLFHPDDFSWNYFFCKIHQECYKLKTDKGVYVERISSHRFCATHIVSEGFCGTRRVLGSCWETQRHMRSPETPGKCWDT